MQTTRIFANGNSQAVRLPREFRFDDDEVVIKKVGDMVVLFPKRYKSAQLQEMLATFDRDFQIERQHPTTTDKRDFGGQ